MGYSSDSLPHIGHIPGRPGQLIIAGFNGHGMPVIWLAARGIAEMIKTGKSFEEISLPRLIKTSSSRIEKAKNGPDGGDIFSMGRTKLVLERSQRMEATQIEGDVK
jgi:hypothetical protein